MFRFSYIIGKNIINKDKFITFSTFDPDILLKEPENKKLSWEDLKKFRNEIYKNL